MPELKDREQVLELLSECAVIKEQFTANEYEMYSHIKEKYEKESEGSFDDKICLEVMLRNIQIRKDLAGEKRTVSKVVNLQTKDKT